MATKFGTGGAVTTVVLEATLVVGLGLAVDGLSGWALGHLGFISVLPGLSEAWGTGIPHTLDIPLLAVTQHDGTVAGERVTF